MTSVNSPACLLARNNFYRNLPTSPEHMSPVFSRQDDSVRHKQKEIAIWITMTSPPGFPGGTKGLWVNIALGSKPPSSANRGVK